MNFIKKYSFGIIAAMLLLIMFGLMYFSAKSESNIVDEIAHIPSGYSYITTGDYHLNPEHPPLIKDLAAIPLVLSGVKFPYDYWRSNDPVINNQWEMGWRFIYQIGNDPDYITILARIPMMLVSLLFGFFVYKWAKELYGKKAGIFALILFAFNTNIIAHSRYVTTDLGISAAFFINMYFIYRFLKNPKYRTLFGAAFTFFVVLVTKFSAAVLVPTYGIVFLMLLFSKGSGDEKTLLTKIHDNKWFKRLYASILSFVIIGLSGIFFMWVFYVLHTINMPAEVQKGLITESLGTGTGQNILLALAGNPVTKPLAQYLLGFVMVASHVQGGHDAYFLGMVSNKGWWYYYPVTIAIKTQIPIFILSILSFVFWKWEKKKDWFTETYFWILPVVLLAMGMQGSINLGIRYMLPIYAFIFVAISKIATMIGFKQFEFLWSSVKNKSGKTKSSILIMCSTITVTLLLFWYVISGVGTFPYYLSYFNEFVGGYKNGYHYLTDSNVDWGQDVKRLSQWAEKEGIEKIYVDVFPGSMPAKYYLGDRMIEWHVQNGRPKGYFALSATFYQNSRLKKNANDGMDYAWLDGVKPIKNLGGSILIYDLR